MREEAFRLGLREFPNDPVLRQAFADWLEEQGDPRGERLRLTHALTRSLDPPNRPACEARLRALVAAGVPSVEPRWTNSVGMEMIWVPSGSFLMGSPAREAERQEDETRHRVTLNWGFYLAVHPVTQAQWHAVVGDNPSRFQDDHRPVEGVSWEDCYRFCKLLARQDGLGTAEPSPYRLPTEAEWEYACRAGSSTPFHSGETLSAKQANFHTNYPPGSGPATPWQETTVVGTYPPNAFGLFDLHGNVFEWCQDWYSAYPDGDSQDPTGKPTGDVRVLRGGSWHSLVRRCRSACRGWGAPGYRGSDVGCRICFRLDADFTI